MRIEETIINVIFDAAKGDVSVSSREAVAGKALGELPTPTRSGFAFAGWYLGEELVTTSTVITSREDICLVARWARKSGAKKVTMYKKQKIAVAVLSVVAVVLVATLIAVKYFTSIYGLHDVYFGDDGTKYTEKYYVKKVDGIYALFDKEGNRMEVNSYGYHIAKSGNQYSIDPETGEFSLYAMVDYDSVGGEVLGYSDRIMMFPQIKQSDTDFIEVTNAHGTYKFYRDDKGYITIAGTEGAMVNYDVDLYASLCVSTGYTLTMQKLDFSLDSVPRLENGSIDYSAYGLADVYDADGKLTYTPARYTIGGKHLKDINGDGVIRADEYVQAEYTVLVGDILLSDGGYYVQLEKGVLKADGYLKEIGKREAVYIVSPDLQATVLQPVEALVMPMISAPITVNEFLKVQEFVLGTANLEEGAVDPSKAKLDIVAAFSFSDIESRLNTLYSSRPYISHNSLTKGYFINDDNASAVLGNMYQMEFVGCKKLGIYRLDENGKPILNSDGQKMLDTEIMKKYNLDKDIYYMSYWSPEIDANGANVTNDKGEQQYIQNRLIISPKTPQGTYYVASLLCDMIVEVDQHYLSFLEWEKSDWYDEHFFSNNLAYMTNLEFVYGDKTYTFTFDNALSYGFYEKSAGKWAVIDLEKGNLVKHENGSYTYYDRNGNPHTVRMVDFSNKEGFSMEKQKIYYTDEHGKYEITVHSPNLYVYCLQYTDGKDDPNLLDYLITHTYPTDSGTEKTELISGVDNFRNFYLMLWWFSIEGDVDPQVFEANRGMTMEEYIAQGEDVCQAILKAKIKDKASVLNQHKNKDGEKEWETDNEMEMVIRFYQYTDWQSLLTIEVIEKYDADGNPISDPTNVVCSFYVDADYIEKIADAAEKLLNKDLIEER